MIRHAGLLLFALAAASCGVELPPHGGAPEQALAAATLARDTAAVTRLLAAGADPNRMVPVQDRPQSPWYIALDQLRPKRPEAVGIIKAMLARGARPDRAWGTSGGDVTRPAESFWKKFMSGSRAIGRQRPARSTSSCCTRCRGPCARWSRPAWIRGSASGRW